MSVPTPLRLAGRGPGLAFLALAGALCVDLLLGPYALVRIHDMFDNAFFYEHFLGLEMLKNGLPFWAPKLGGLPSFAGLFPPYGPLSVFGLALPPWLLAKAWEALCLAAGAWGMYRLLGEYLELDRRAALFVAVPFALTGLVYHPFVFACYFPLLFMLVADATGGRGGTGFRLGRLGMALFLAYLSQPVLVIAVYSVLHLAIVLLFDHTPWRPRRIAAAFLFWTGYLLIYAPTFLSLLGFAPLSHRGGQSGPPASLWSILSSPSEMFGYPLGVCLSLAVALYFAWEARSCKVTRKTLLLCLGTLAAMLLEGVKPLFGTTPLRYVDFYHFNGAFLVAASILAGAGASRALREGAGLSRRELLLRAGAAIGLVALWSSADGILLKALLLLFVLAGLYAARLAAGPDFPGRARRLGLAAGLCGLGLAAGVGQMETVRLMDHSFVPYAKGFGHHRLLLDLAKEQGAEPFRTAGINLSPAVAQSHGLETADLLTQLYARQYRDWFEAMLAPQLDTPEKRANYKNTAFREVFLVPSKDADSTRRYLVYNNNAQTSAGMWNMPLLKALGVRYLISPRPVEGLGAFADLEGVDNGPGAPGQLGGAALNRAYSLPLCVYRLRGAFPRAWLAERAQVLPDEAAVRAALPGQTEASLASTALIAAQDARELPPSFLAGPAPQDSQPASAGASEAGPEALAVERHAAGLLVLSGRIPGPRLLMVSNTFHPGWRALVNGKPAPVLRADHAFQAVPLPGAGPVRVELSFDDPLAARAHWLTLLGLGLMACCALLGRTPAPPGSSLTSLAASAGPPPALPADARAALRRALLWGLAGALAVGLLFLLLRALREPAASQRLVWFILAKALASGLLAAPVAALLLRLVLADPANPEAQPKEPRP